MSETTKPAITLATRDSTGYVPDLNLIGRQYVHSGNNKTYIIRNFVWLSETDEWGLQHYDTAMEIEYVRSVRNFFSDRQGILRFSPKN